jgi:hypothetical protein
LARDKLFFIQPGVDPAFGEKSLVEFTNNGFVLRGVAEKYAEFAVGGRHQISN